MEARYTTYNFLYTLEQMLATVFLQDLTDWLSKHQALNKFNLDRLEVLTAVTTRIKIFL